MSCDSVKSDKFLLVWSHKANETRHPRQRVARAAKTAVVLRGGSLDQYRLLEPRNTAFMSSPDHHHAQNAAAYEAMVARDHPLCRPASQNELKDPLGTIDPTGWLGDSIAGRRVLCLAAGGGRHSQLYVAAGAIVTVVDLSPAMLQIDRQNQTAIKTGLLRIIHSSMDHMPMLQTGEFDIVVQPVSTCYVPDLAPVFAEVARVLRPGGCYISQHKSPINLQASTDCDRHGRYVIEHGYYERSPAPKPNHQNECSKRLREPGAVEFSHRLETIFGGICRSGFVIEDVTEPDHHDHHAAAGSFSHRANFIAPYLRIKASRIGNAILGQW